MGILDKWRLKGALNDLVTSRDCIKINRYIDAQNLILSSTRRLKKLPANYDTKNILNKIDELESLLIQEKGRYSKSTKNQIDGLFSYIMPKLEQMLKNPPAPNLVPEYS